jgi:Fe-S-cluster formation regulator IscX/YfhJ
MSSAEVRQELHREVRRLDGRVDALDESLRAVGDTLIDVKETVDGHTVTLAEHGQVLVELKDTVDGHTVTLAEHSRVLVELKDTVDGHTVTLAEHGHVLDDHTRLLQEILRRLPEPAGS